MKQFYFLVASGYHLSSSQFSWILPIVLQVDLTEYEEKHEFVFDAVLNEEVSNDEVII